MGKLSECGAMFKLIRTKFKIFEIINDGSLLSEKRPGAGKLRL